MAFLQLLFGIRRGAFSVNVPGQALPNPWFSLSEGKGKAASDRLCGFWHPVKTRSKFLEKISLEM